MEGKLFLGKMLNVLVIQQPPQDVRPCADETVGRMFGPQMGHSLSAPNLAENELARLAGGREEQGTGRRPQVVPWRFCS